LKGTDGLYYYFPDKNQVYPNKMSAPLSSKKENNISFTNKKMIKKLKTCNFKTAIKKC